MSDQAADRALDALMLDAAQTWSARADCEEAIGVIGEDLFRLMDAAIAVLAGSFRALNNRAVSRANTAPKDLVYVVSTLATRTQVTAQEILALLRTGYPYGAKARWRTLHEVAVVASVIAQGDRHTATRFKNHRWMIIAKERRHQNPPALWAGGPSPEAMERQLLRRYGKTYGSDYGWATAVVGRALEQTKPNWSPRWGDLVRVADLDPAHRHHARDANHSVHSDSLSGLDLVTSDGLLHVGPTVGREKPIVSHTVALLIDVTDTLFALTSRYDPTPVVLAAHEFAQRMLIEIEREVSRVTA